MLLNAFLRLVEELQATFAQQRSFERARRLLLCGLLVMGRRWISRSISAAGRDQQEYSGDYKLFSRAPWDASALFKPVLRHTAAMCETYLGVALDETKVPRTGKKIRQAGWMRDPLSPPFHVNFMWGMRFLQFSALVPLHEKHAVAARGFPVGFTHVPQVRKPRKGASKEDEANYKKAQKENNLSTHARQQIQTLRERYDQAGFEEKTLVIAGDGSFCNRTIFRHDWKRTLVIARTRKDAALCWPAPENSRRYYSRDTFTPEEVRQDSSIPWHTATIFHGGRPREVRYKILTGVLWRRGAGRKPLRLIVLAATPYRLTKQGKSYYRQPAYLLVTDTEAPVERMIQIYFDRWQIEVNHRDEKEIIGVGHAQVWSEQSVPRHPVFMAAAYSMLLLASLQAYGPCRTHDYPILPKWRKPAVRPSCLDMISLLRQQALKAREELEAYGIHVNEAQLIEKAAA